MGFGPAIGMVLAGAAVAFGLLIAAVLRRGPSRDGRGQRSRPARETIEASILCEVLLCGGMNRREAGTFLDSELHVSAPVVDDIDLQNWAEEYGRRYGATAAQELLETAVRAAVMSSAVVSLPQYNALLDLCFRLGLQTDALARLRARYRFAYVDYARHGRPRSADRIGRPSSRVDTNEMMRLLELEGMTTRHEVVSAYRRLAAQCHPDRFHGAAPDEQQAAAERFIRLTEAYETLLSICPEE